jgi:5,10-methylenetetrahydrofolate reductase
LVSLFQEGLQSGSFQVVARLTPPKGVNLSQALSLVESWKGKVDAVLVADNPSARMGLSALITAERLKRDGHEVILTISCRDRNRLDLASTALGAGAAAIDTVLCVSGDHPNFGDHPDAKPVYDLDSVQLISMLKEMGNGKDVSGNPTESFSSFFLGAAVCASADPLGPQLMKARKKAAVGASFFITLPIFSLDQLTPFLDGVSGLPAKVIAGVFLPSFEEISRYFDGSIPGTFIPEDLVARWRNDGEEAFMDSSAQAARELIAELRGVGKVAGVCISATGRESEISGLF